MTVANAKPDQLIRGPLGTTTVNAASSAWWDVSTVEAKISEAIAYAVSIGAKAVYVPDCFLPYNASLVTFNTAVKMTREGGDPSVVDVKAYGAAGNAAQDDTVAIQAAANASTAGSAAGGILFFPFGNYLVSSYITVQSGFRWLGVGWQASGTVGTSITATGANAGILQFRPGTIGVKVPTSGAEGYVEGIAFRGGATTGHLVTLARCNNIRFRYCAFYDSTGTGFLDDGVTPIGAHGLYMYGCEQMSIEDCQFANLTNATGGCIGVEAGVHGVWLDACHGSSFTYWMQFTGTDVVATATSNLYHHNCFWINGVSIFRVGANALPNQVSCFGCRMDSGFTAVSPAGTYLDNGALAGRLFGWNAFGSWLSGVSGATGVIISRVYMDSSVFLGCHFDSAATVFGNNFQNGGNVCLGSDLNSVTALYASGDPVGNGFALSSGSNPTGWAATATQQQTVAMSQKRVALTDGATVAVNLALANDFFLAANGSRTISNYTNPPQGQNTTYFAVTISNITVGAITTTWSGNYHLASAWVDPATLKQRTIWFRLDGATGVAYEMSRNATDVTP